MKPTSSHDYAVSKVLKIFKADIKQPSLVKAEKTGRIPAATRRGKAKSRYWSTVDLPEIGQVYGHFKKPLSCEVFCVYAPKGGIGKSSFSFNFSRLLALHNIKVLLVGMDFQCSLSKYFGFEYESIEEKMPLSLFECIGTGEVSLKDTIIKTDIPSLYLVPESTELNILDKYIYTRNRREYLLQEQIAPLKNIFDVIIIDCPPYWNQSVTNALIAGNRIVAPINADGESFHSFKVYMRELKKFMKDMNKKYDSVKFIINNIDLRTKYNNEFKSKLTKQYGSIFTEAFIRESITVKEAGSNLRSVIEYSPSSNVADDYYRAIMEIWSEVKTEKDS